MCSCSANSRLSPPLLPSPPRTRREVATPQSTPPGPICAGAPPSPPVGEDEDGSPAACMCRTHAHCACCRQS
eukprot:4038615-Pyramimonas_sp.AAC.1